MSADLLFIGRICIYMAYIRSYQYLETSATNIYSLTYCSQAMLFLSLHLIVSAVRCCMYLYIAATKSSIGLFFPLMPMVQLASLYIRAVRADPQPAT